MDVTSQPSGMVECEAGSWSDDDEPQPKQQPTVFPKPEIVVVKDKLGYHVDKNGRPKAQPDIPRSFVTNNAKFHLQGVLEAILQLLRSETQRSYASTEDVNEAGTLHQPGISCILLTSAFRHPFFPSPVSWPCNRA